MAGEREAPLPVGDCHIKTVAHGNACQSFLAPVAQAVAVEVFIYGAVVGGKCCEPSRCKSGCQDYFFDHGKGNRHNAMDYKQIDTRPHGASLNHTAKLQKIALSRHPPAPGAKRRFRTNISHQARARRCAGSTPRGASGIGRAAYTRSAIRSPLPLRLLLRY